MSLHGGFRKRYATQSDTYTGVATGATLTFPIPFCRFGMKVKQTGSGVLWTIILEADLDGSGDFTTLLTHVQTTGNGTSAWLAAPSPAIAVRTRCTALTLGILGTNVVATLLAREE